MNKSMEQYPTDRCRCELDKQNIIALENCFLFLTKCVMNVEWLSWFNRHIRQFQTHSSQSILPNNFKRFNKCEPLSQSNLLTNSLKNSNPKKYPIFHVRMHINLILRKQKNQSNDVDAITLEPFWIHWAIQAPKLL